MGPGVVLTPLSSPLCRSLSERGLQLAEESRPCDGRAGPMPGTGGDGGARRAVPQPAPRAQASAASPAEPVVTVLENSTCHSDMSQNKHVPLPRGAGAAGPSGRGAGSRRPRVPPPRPGEHRGVAREAWGGPAAWARCGLSPRCTLLSSSLCSFSLIFWPSKTTSVSGRRRRA